MSSLWRPVLVGIGALFWCLAAQAANNTIQFSAEAVQQTPDRPAMKARIFVGKDAVRSEYEMNDQKFIEIVRKQEEKRIILNPARKEYMLQQGTSVVLPQTASKKKDVSPCEGVANVKCEKKSEEEVNGRKAEKWEFVSDYQGRELRSLVWIDVKKRFPVRQLYPDGSMLEMNLLGKEKINDRMTEKWEVVNIQPTGQRSRSLQWHDMKLEIAIREELPGGYVRELKNIKIGNQPDTLFNVPADYKQIEMPAMPAKGAAR